MVRIILLEILAGARDELRADELRRLLGRCRPLRAQEPFDYEAAAAINRTCRQTGATVRRLPDCLIAAIAIRTGARLLHHDGDFETIARVTPPITVALDGSSRCAALSAVGRKRI